MRSIISSSLIQRLGATISRGSDMQRRVNKPGFFAFLSEIYRIVSQRQIRDESTDTSRIGGDVRPIHIPPTEQQTPGGKKCC